MAKLSSPDRNICGLLSSASKPTKKLMFELLSVDQLVAKTRRVSSGQSRILGVFTSLDITWKQTATFPVAINSIAPPFATETAIGYLPAWSPSQSRKAMPTCLRSLTQLILLGWYLAFASAGKIKATAIAKTYDNCHFDQCQRMGDLL